MLHKTSSNEGCYCRDAAATAPVKQWKSNVIQPLSRKVRQIGTVLFIAKCTEASHNLLLVTAI